MTPFGGEIFCLFRQQLEIPTGKITPPVFFRSPPPMTNTKARHPGKTRRADFAADGRSDRWQSLYYPGEAALGLLMLYEHDGSPIWLESATRALTYLARSREHVSDPPADHWALLATEKLLSFENKAALPVPRRLLINHAIQICKSILQSQIENHQRPEYDDGFADDGRTTPTATRLEGLQATLSFLPSDHDVRKGIESAVSRGISFLLRAQIREGDFAGAIPRAIGRIDRDIPGADTFNRRATEVRIDYVQHALSAMLQYLHRARKGEV